jgi:hypothetical protein
VLYVRGGLGKSEQHALAAGVEPSAQVTCWLWMGGERVESNEGCVLEKEIEYHNVISIRFGLFIVT